MFLSAFRVCFAAALLGQVAPAWAEEEVLALTPFARAVLNGETALDVATIGDWQLACDNTARCTLLGHADMADPNHVVPHSTRSLAMRLEVGADGVTDKLELIPDAQLTEQVVDGIDWTGPFTLSIDNLRGAPVTVPYNRIVMAATDRAIVVDYLHGGLPLTGTDPLSGEQRLRLPFTGFAEAMAEVARRQRHLAEWRRVVARDDGPVRLVRAEPMELPVALLVSAEQMDWCGSGIDAADLAVFVDPNGAQIWQHSCPVSDGRNTLSRWIIQQAGASEAHLFRFPRTPGFAAEEMGTTLTTAAFAHDYGVIISDNIAWGGRDDCGSRAVWGWTGEAFVAVERRVSLVCQGLGVGDWLVTWRRDVIQDQETVQ